MPFRWLVDFTREQENAIASVRRWLASGTRPWFYLAGYAGTGKTTIAKTLAEGLGRVEFAAPTGKAAQVLQRKGCAGATTVHRLIYLAGEKSRARLLHLENELERVSADIRNGAAWCEGGAGARKLFELDQAIQAERRRADQPSFSVNPEAPLMGAELLILDECSMVDERLASDILSFGVPVLALGDPAQLPPVKGAGYFTRCAPDALLTEVKRQALESEVLRLATRVREGRELFPGEYECGTRILPFDAITAADAQGVDVVLTGRNLTRRNFNRRLRELAGFSGPWPQKGEPLIGLNNRHDLGIFNGSLLRATTDAAPFSDHDLTMVVEREDVPGEVGITARKHEFRLYDDAAAIDRRGTFGRRERVDVDWAYALTVHKAQGSQWPSVLVADDGFARGRAADRRAWLYTAITRAESRVVIGLSE